MSGFPESPLGDAVPDPSIVIPHAPNHEDGGADEINVDGLSGLLADDQHVLDAEVQAVSINNVVEDTTPQLGGDLDCNGHKITSPAAELTIAAGTVTITQSTHRIDTQFDDASDELDTINGGVDGDLLIIRADHTDRTIVLKDGTGNLDLWTGDIELDEIDKYLILTYDGTLSKWVIAGGAGLNVVSDAVYGAGWDGVTKRAPSKNAVYDEMETKLANVVEDTTPQLGANLDKNAFGIIEAITSHSATEAVTAATMYGNIHKITGAYTLTLPTAVVGMSGLFRSSTAAIFSIKAGAGCHFEMIDGTVLDNGDKQTSGGTKNAWLHIHCETANVWITSGQHGTMEDTGA